jgi:hypothetical protein
MMRMLSDIVLIECYLDSLELELDDDFIELLLTEMKERNIEIPSMDTYDSPYNDNTALFHSTT